MSEEINKLEREEEEKKEEARDAQREAEEAAKKAATLLHDADKINQEIIRARQEESKNLNKQNKH